MNGTGQNRDRLLYVADLHFWQVVKNPLHLLNKRFLGNFNVLFRRRWEFPMDRVGDVANALEATGIGQVLLGGDLTSTSLATEFAMARRFVDGLVDSGLEPIILPGNHDVYTFEAVRAQRFERHFEGLLPKDGYPSTHTLPGGTPVVLAPTVCPNLVSSKGRVTNDTVRAVAKLLESCEGPVIVAGHYPVLHDTYGYTVRASRRLRNAEALRQALGASGRTILYVCGHVHEFSYVKDPELPALWHLSTGAMFRNDPHRGRQGEFAEIHVTHDVFDVFHHTLEGQWRREQVSPR